MPIVLGQGPLHRLSRWRCSSTAPAPAPAKSWPPACRTTTARSSSGERSYGKGTVQEVVDLGQTFGAMKLTIATYWRPSGQNINRPKDDAKNDGKNAAWGVSPNEGYDVPVEDDERKRLLSLAAGARIGRTRRRKGHGRRRSAGSRAVESRRVLGIEGGEVGEGGKEIGETHWVAVTAVAGENRARPMRPIQC